MSIFSPLARHPPAVYIWHMHPSTLPPPPPASEAQALREEASRRRVIATMCLKSAAALEAAAARIEAEDRAKFGKLQADCL